MPDIAMLDAKDVHALLVLSISDTRLFRPLPTTPTAFAPIPANAPNPRPLLILPPRVCVVLFAASKVLWKFLSFAIRTAVTI